MSFDMNPSDDDPHGECRHEIRRLESVNAELLDALKQVCDWFGFHPAGKLPLDQWEDLAAEFYAETGFLRPGKDYPAAAGLTEEQESERSKTWSQWAANRRLAIVEKARAAIAQATSGGEGEGVDG